MTITKAIKRFLIAVIVVLLVLLVITAVKFNTIAPVLSERDYLRLVPQVITLVQQRYVEKVDRKKLIEGAISGMLSSLDPHSAYLPPEYFNEMNIEISGAFGGVGLEIAMTDGRLTVIAPIDDTPAFRAGIKSGDIIWKIDGRSTRDLNINEAVKRMRGPEGTAVKLSIFRRNTPRPLLFNVTRDLIRTKSVKTRTLEQGYGYVRIAHFQERTGEEFAAALHSLRRENGGLRGLVIDLRNNPGGLLEAAVSVAGRFIDPRGKNGLVVYTKGREEGSRMTLTAANDEKEPRYPVAVLINGGSASASEIVAGALQDHKRGVIIGTQSFGKGSVQTLFSLPGGAGLKLTTARYYTPNGRSIQAKGITPDIIVDNGDIAVAAKDRGMVIRERDLDNHFPGANEGEEELQTSPAAKAGEKAVADTQLDRALDLLKGINGVGLTK